MCVSLIAYVTFFLSGCLIEILASRTNAEIVQIKAAYKKDIGRDLEKDLMSETSGHFKRLLVSLTNACRDESSPPNLVRRTGWGGERTGTANW